MSEESKIARLSALSLLLLMATSLDAGAQARDAQIQKAGSASRGPLLVDSFDSVSQWSTNPAQGVEITVHPDSGRHGRGMRIDFDFHGHPGYGIVHRNVDLDLPANYEFSFALRGEAPTNTLEFKLVDAANANVWWSNNSAFIFPREWRTIARQKRQICYAWGPPAGGEIRHVSAIEIAITAGSGGRGSLWLDDLALISIDPESPFDVIPPVASIPIVGTWESVATPDGGVPFTLDYAMDGSYTLRGGPTADFSYSVADNRLTTTVKDLNTGESRQIITAIRIDHDTLIQKDGNGPGNDVTMTRVRPVKDSNNSILGIWSFSEDNGATAFVAFSKNGLGTFRLPMSSCSGTWTNAGSGQLTEGNCMLWLVPNRRTCTIGQVPTRMEYSIENGVLTIKNDRGNEAKYNRRAPRD
jgi:hypothetical protein